MAQSPKLGGEMSMKYRKLSDLQKDVETLKGEWELSPDHELVYKERRQTIDYRPETSDQ